MWSNRRHFGVMVRPRWSEHPFRRHPSLLSHAYSVYGITVLQAYIYYKNSHRDSVYMRSFVSSSTQDNLNLDRKLTFMLHRSRSCCTCHLTITLFIIVTLVPSVSILDTTSLGLAIQTIYEYVVIDFGNPLLLINMPP